MSPEVSEIFATLDYGPAPEDASPARAWIAEHEARFGHWIGGRWVEPGGSQRFETLHPGNGQVLARVAQGSAADVDAAVAAARAALPAWQALSGHERARHLYALSRMVQRRSRLFSVLETLDNGKPIRESRDIDVPLVARHFLHHAGWAELAEREFLGFRPVGVCGAIIPWNFPLLMLAWKVAPALAAGNTVVLKPAEFTSLTALLFAEASREAGLPDGVLNVVTGDGRAGEALVHHAGVDKIAFTGSTEVGRLIREATAGTGKKLTLELGGKSPFLVFDDADLDAVVEGVVDAIWFNQGQVCCAGSRILAQEGVARRLEEKLKRRMETLRVGDPLDKAVDIGAIIAPQQLERIGELVAEGEREGATLWQPSWSCPEDGWFYPPTLLTGVGPAATVAQVEIFGPVVVMMSFRTPAEAVELANNTRYGLAASVWTDNLNLALDIAPRLAAGSVWINCTNVFDAASGFGGYRESGFGREGGREGMWEYLKPDHRGELAEADWPSEESLAATSGEPAAAGAIDRSPKLYVGGRQRRPDAPYVLPVAGAKGELLGEVPRGNRKDIRDAVEAAHAGTAWSEATAHNRAQVLYYMAENLAAREEEFIERLAAFSGDGEAAAREVRISLERLFHWAAWADKWDGAVHRTPLRNVTLAMPEPLGVVALVCPAEAPLLGLVSTAGALLALGNRVLAVPSARFPLAATDLYQVLETSDLPDGALNIVTGVPDELARVLAAHDDVDGIWYFGSAAGSAEVERLSVGNLKRTWVSGGTRRDWYDPEQGAGQELLRRACQIKNIWIPYGE
ncbi:MAG: aldehyde dehydrogenase family protein [Thermoanaerobaculia bacterium]